MGKIHFLMMNRNILPFKVSPKRLGASYIVHVIWHLVIKWNETIWLILHDLYLRWWTWDLTLKEDSGWVTRILSFLSWSAAVQYNTPSISAIFSSFQNWKLEKIDRKKVFWTLWCHNFGKHKIVHQSQVEKVQQWCWSAITMSMSNAISKLYDLKQV